MSKENQMQTNTVLALNSYIHKHILKEWGAICTYEKQFISKGRKLKLGMG